MKQMEQNRYTMILSALEKAVGEVGGYVTAGRVASAAGVSRNTAKKWLEKLYNQDRVLKKRGVHVNYQDKAGYSHIPPCPVCSSTRRDEGGWTEERGYGALYRHWEVLCRDCGEYLDGGTIDLQD